MTGRKKHANHDRQGDAGGNGKFPDIVPVHATTVGEATTPASAASPASTALAVVRPTLPIPYAVDHDPSPPRLDICRAERVLPHLASPPPYLSAGVAGQSAGRLAVRRCRSSPGGGAEQSFTRAVRTSRARLVGMAAGRLAARPAAAYPPRRQTTAIFSQSYKPRGGLVEQWAHTPARQTNPAAERGGSVRVLRTPAPRRPPVIPARRR